MAKHVIHFFVCQIKRGMTYEESHNRETKIKEKMMSHLKNLHDYVKDSKSLKIFQQVSFYDKARLVQVVNGHVV